MDSIKEIENLLTTLKGTTFNDHKSLESWLRKRLASILEAQEKKHKEEMERVVREMVGGKDESIQFDKGWGLCATSYNKKRQEIIDIAQSMGINLE